MNLTGTLIQAAMFGLDVWTRPVGLSVEICLHFALGKINVLPPSSRGKQVSSGQLLLVFRISHCKKIMGITER